MLQILKFNARNKIEWKAQDCINNKQGMRNDEINIVITLKKTH